MAGLGRKVCCLRHLLNAVIVPRFPAVGKCSFHPLWVRSFVIHHVVLDLKLLCLVVDNPLSSLSFSPASSNLAMFAQTVGFSWSCVGSTASLRLRTLFHVLRDQSTRTTHSVSPELVCSWSSLLSKQLQHCLSHTRRLFRFSALSAPLCGSLQRRTCGLHVWHLRHHCVVVGSR